ncbi:MAG: (deoxy)nucleoside triphosphate pyrophosphohydrolase [Spirochaetales bacterium]|nr:(deoxy)nucleoside triphosphate pyrophosphohydrolase [Spirochaetales bacterium]
MQNVVAAVMIKDGKYLIAKRKEGGSLSGKWEFPGGKVEPGETDEQAMKRELFEEFEIEVKMGEFIGSHEFSNKNKLYTLQAYNVTYLSGEFKLHEHDEIAWVLPGEFGSYDFADSDKAIISILTND